MGLLNEVGTQQCERPMQVVIKPINLADKRVEINENNGLINLTNGALPLQELFSRKIAQTLAANPSGYDIPVEAGYKHSSWGADNTSMGPKKAKARPALAYDELAKLWSRLYGLDQLMDSDDEDDKGKKVTVLRTLVQKLTETVFVLPQIESFTYRKMDETPIVTQNPVLVGHLKKFTYQNPQAAVVVVADILDSLDQNTTKNWEGNGMLEFIRELATHAINGGALNPIKEVIIQKLQTSAKLRSCIKNYINNDTLWSIYRENRAILFATIEEELAAGEDTVASKGLHWELENILAIMETDLTHAKNYALAFLANNTFSVFSPSEPGCRDKEAIENERAKWQLCLSILRKSLHYKQSEDDAKSQADDIRLKASAMLPKIVNYMNRERLADLVSIINKALQDPLEEVRLHASKKLPILVSNFSGFDPGENYPIQEHYDQTIFLQQSEKFIDFLLLLRNIVDILKGKDALAQKMASQDTDALTTEAQQQYDNINEMAQNALKALSMLQAAHLDNKYVFSIIEEGIKIALLYNELSSKFNPMGPKGLKLMLRYRGDFSKIAYSEKAKLNKASDNFPEVKVDKIFPGCYKEIHIKNEGPTPRIFPGEEYFGQGDSLRGLLEDIGDYMEGQTRR